MESAPHTVGGMKHVLQLNSHKHSFDTLDHNSHENDFISRFTALFVAMPFLLSFQSAAFCLPSVSSWGVAILVTLHVYTVGELPRV